MRASAKLTKIARACRTVKLHEIVERKVQTEVEAWMQQQGFAPTSGYATTERAQTGHDWHRPTIGFSPNGF